MPIRNSTFLWHKVVGAPPPALPSPDYVPGSLASGQTITTGVWKNATEWTWFMDFTTNYDSSVAPNGQYALYGSVAAGGTVQYIIYNRDGKWGCYVEAGAGVSFIASDLIAVNTDRIRVALRMKANDFAIAFNGTVTSVDASGSVPDVDKLQIGIADFLGTIHAIEGYTTLSDSQLVQITTPP